MSSSIPILIVDDEEDLVVLFKQFLIELGFNVVSFTNSLLAFEHFKMNTGRYSLVITDLRMPGMNGIELANKIREINNTVKIFLITAFDIQDLENRINYKSAKIDQLIQKPLRFSILKEMINLTFNTQYIRDN
ncbi:MAG: response regulator [Nitrosopumilus sp.]|nr:response regulator [Nitrosopumilus sp.]